MPEATRSGAPAIPKPASIDLTAAITEAMSDMSSNEPENLADFGRELDGDDGDETTDEPSTAEASTEASSADEGETPPVPDSYWGVDLTGIPEAKARELIAHFEQQDGTIRKLQARLQEPLEAPPAPEVAEEVTDAQLLAAYGIDPEDYSVPDVLKAALVTQGRNQLLLEDQVTQLTNMEQGRSLETQWNRELDELEATYGKLTGTREEVLRYALSEAVPTPADLYFKLTAPVKREVESLAAAARREAFKREQSGGTMRPRSSSAEPAAVQPGMSIRDAVKAAALEAQKDTGMSWKTALKRKLVPTPESS